MQGRKNYFCIWTRQWWSLCSFSVPVGNNIFLLQTTTLAHWDFSVLWICSFSSLWASKYPQQKYAQRNFSAVLTWEFLTWQRTQIPSGPAAEAAFYWWGNFAHLHPRQQQVACSCWHIRIIHINPNCSSSACQAQGTCSILNLSSELLFT